MPDIPPVSSGGGEGVTAHGDLTQLDYANAGHTDFARTSGTNTFAGAQTVDGAADAVQLAVQANGTQTANIQEWQTSAGAARVAIAPDYRLHVRPDDTGGEIIFGVLANQPSIQNYQNAGLCIWNSGWTHDFKVMDLPGSGTAAIRGSPTDSGTAVGVILDAQNALSTSGAKIISFRNAGVEKASVYHDGMFAAASLNLGGATVLDVLTATATLDFSSGGSISANQSVELTITVTGAAVGDAVFVTVPLAATVDSVSYLARVSAADTVTVRASNTHDTDGISPASGTFRAVVLKF